MCSLQRILEAARPGQENSVVVGGWIVWNRSQLLQSQETGLQIKVPLIFRSPPEVPSSLIASEVAANGGAVRDQSSPVMHEETGQ